MYDHISEKTRNLTMLVSELGVAADLDLGPAASTEQNGDMVWFILTDQQPGITNLFLIIVTPHVLLAEYNFEHQREFSVIDDIGLLLEHLKGLGYRKLSPDESKLFMEG